jgi:imidazolonepropionase-like amidohydrolase
MRLDQIVTAALLGLLAGAPALAEPVYLTAEKFIDPVSGEIVRTPAFILENGKVKARGTRNDLKAPAGARRVDLGRQTLMPGFIDMHVHLTGDADIGPYLALGLSDERRAIKGVKNARLTLLAGFTTVRNVGAESYGDVALRDAIAEGEVIGPRMLVSGPPVGITGGHCSDENLLPSEYGLKGEAVANGPWEMRAQVRENIKYGADVIKTCSTGGVLSKGTALGAAQGTLEELTAIVEEAHARGLKVASHAHGTVGIKNAILAGIDTIEHASLLDDEAIRLAIERGTYLSMDIYNTEYILSEGEKNGLLKESLDKERSISAKQRASFSAAVKAGAKVVFGSDAGVYPHGMNGHQFSRMVQFGMTPIQALQAGTSLAAEALGKSGEAGCADVGCHADFVAIDGDPLADMTRLANVAFVMKAGLIYKRDGKALGEPE